MADEVGRLLERIGKLEQRERFGDALALARRAAEVEPDEPAVWEARGEMALRCGDAEEAVAALRRLTRLEPESGEGWFRLGEALQWRGAADEAEGCFGRAAELEPAQHTRPFRISTEEFEAVAGEVLRSLPAQFVDFLEETGTGIAVRPLPALEMVVEDGLDPHALGYWLGNVFGAAGAWGEANPAAIEIYQLNIENWSADRDGLFEEIRRTVLHEVGHALGMDHAALDQDGYA